jgi:four helix bundle protein
MKTHKDLNVWKESMLLVTLIYEKTKSFPKDELFALTSQIRRSAISIPSNISEGAARESNKEFLRFLFIAQGSISELDTQLLIANNLNFLCDTDYSQIDEKMVSIRKMLTGLIKFRKGKTPEKYIGSQTPDA